MHLVVDSAELRFMIQGLECRDLTMQSLRPACQDGSGLRASGLQWGKDSQNCVIRRR